MSIIYNKELPVRHDVDVFVAGGGPAGCAAAIAAARNGASVFLAEEQACFGGLGTSGLVPAYMQFGDGENFLAAALGQEILERLWQYGGPEYAASKTLSIKVESLKRVYDDLLVESGAKFALHTKLVDVVMDGDRISHCVLAAKSGVFAVRAKVYIDGTGDGDLAAWSGVPYDKGDDQGRMMAGTLCALWTNVDWSREAIVDGSRIEEAYNAGVFKKLDRHLPGMWKISDRVAGSNVGHVYDVDGTDERSLTDGLLYTRKLYDQYEEYYHKYLPRFESMEMVVSGAMLGIRESRRIRGEYQLVLDDFLNQAVFEDEIGRFAYPVDIHASDNSDKSHEQFMKGHHGYRYQKGQSYGVPYRVLVPQKIDNLLVAGRCVSTDRPMQSSIRVMPGCYLTGQAAGVSAALCVKDGLTPRTVDVRQIQTVLKDMGMYLPNFQV
ncbi:MAG: FAD-dependent oxidoreductase [Oscillospiraceae bacterium]|jgi:hypothetical protein|nr:FAD-dependent oxidoreductase [Oscillospiraceae bacterium]